MENQECEWDNYVKFEGLEPMRLSPKVAKALINALDDYAKFNAPEIALEDIIFMGITRYWKED